MTGAGPRTRSGDDLVRQLASAYASYRLFPGDTSQPAFRAAVDRVEATAGMLLAAGPFHTEIKSARFHTASGEVRHDDTLDRLALALFDRRVEHLHVHAVPTADELASFGEFLSLPIDEVVDRGGAGAVLRASGVTSITVGEVGEDDDTDDPALDELSPDQRRLWEQLQEPGTLAATLLIEGMPSDPAAAAHDLYVRFRTIEEILPSQLTARRDFFVRIRQVFEHLPVAVGREFDAIVLTRLATERFAMSFGVNLTDQELVDVLFALADYGGPDPMELGRRVVAMTDRKSSVLDLIAAHAEAAGAGLAELTERDGATLVALTLSEANVEVRSAVADALSEQLVSASSQDAAAIRELFPASSEDGRTLALLAFRDYLAVEDRRVSVDRVLGVWAAAVRAALLAGDRPLVQRLLDTVDAAIPQDADVFKRDAVARARASVPTPEVVATLLAERPVDAPAEALAGVLAPFGAGGLEAVLEQLATEDAASMRSALIALAGALAPGHLDVITERIDDQRWYVVRNLVSIVGRAGPDPDAVPTLARLVRHPDPTVRREVARSLVACAGADAVPYLRRLAGDAEAPVATAARHALAGISADGAARALADIVRRGDGADDRRAVLDALAGHPSPETPALLRELASRDTDPRLPGPLRRHAKRLARGRAGGRS